MKRISIFCASALILLNACETTEAPEPEPAPPPVVQSMSEAQFASALRSAEADANPYSGEQKLTQLVNNTSLTSDQRARALYARGSQRRTKSFDKIGAKADFDEFARLYPSSPYANNARIESGYVQTEMQDAQSRLRTLQTLPEWFDDTWSLGKRDEAAARYRRSGLTPDPHQVSALRATGFLCEGSGAKKVHNYGPLTADIQNLYWCK